MPFSEDLLPISYIRQHCFCPRIPWYKSVMQFEPPEQAWVTQGKAWHSAQEQLHKQRLPQSIDEPIIRKTNCYVKDLTLGIHGYIDEFNYNQTQGVVLEYKSDMAKPVASQKYQLSAYAMAASRHFNVKIDYGILLKGSGYKQFRIKVENKLKLEVINIIDTVRQNMSKASLPTSSAQESKCVQCEYLRYCNDR